MKPMITITIPAKPIQPAIEPFITHPPVSAPPSAPVGPDSGQWPRFLRLWLTEATFRPVCDHRQTRPAGVAGLVPSLQWGSSARARCPGTKVRASAALCELAGAEHRCLNRVQERGADARDLELADRGGGRASGRCHHLPQLDRVHAQVAHLLRR